jgi:uncharacterized phiE125 gp8 family phage protein
MYKVVTPAAVEPVSLSELKVHIRQTGSDASEDALLDDVLRGAREWCEAYCGRALCTQTLELILDRFPGCDIKLPKPPLQSVTSIKYKDSTGTESTVDTSDYIVDADSDIGRVVPAYGLYWPSFTAYPVNPIRIRYVAGYTAVPAAIKDAIKLYAGLLYVNRDLDVAEDTDKVALAVRALLDPYRVRWWDG